MNDEQRAQIVAAFERISTDIGILRDMIFADELEGAAQPDRVQITAQPRLRVRKEPHTKADIVGWLNYDVAVELQERTESGWGRITDPPGWIDLVWTKPKG